MGRMKVYGGSWDLHGVKSMDHLFREHLLSVNQDFETNVPANLCTYQTVVVAPTPAAIPVSHSAVNASTQIVDTETAVPTPTTPTTPSKKYCFRKLF